SWIAYLRLSFLQDVDDALERQRDRCLLELREFVERCRKCLLQRRRCTLRKLDTRRCGRNENDAPVFTPPFTADETLLLEPIQDADYRAGAHVNFATNGGGSDWAISDD